MQIGHNDNIIASNLASKYLVNDSRIQNDGQNINCVQNIFGICHALAVIKNNNLSSLSVLLSVMFQYFQYCHSTFFNTVSFSDEQLLLVIITIMVSGDSHTG